MSLMGAAGKYLASSMKPRKRRQMEPLRMTISTHRGKYQPQLWGRKSCAVDVITIQSRSDHIPMLTQIEMMNSSTKLVRTRLKTNNSGNRTLPITISG
jgi:hypothetical protein